MKKTAIALAMALTGFATAATAAPLDNTWYTGAKVGWSYYHDTGFYDGVPNNNHDRPHQLGAGAYVGYQANQYVGFEFGYDWLGRNAFKDDGLGNTGAYKAHVLQLAAKLSYPIMNDLDIYTRLGAAGWRADSSTKDAAGNRFSDFTTGVSPMAAVGLEYAITPSIATRLDYQWINNIGDGDDIGTRPDNGMLSLGLAYRFGQDKPAPVVAVPVVETKRFTLKSDVLFAFNKSNLKPEGQQALDQLYGELSSINPQDGAIVVLGYTDRIGSEQYNQKLSEQRAQSVVSYLVSKGIPADKISARGLGKSNPVTGSTCDGMKRGAALIDCLAPDRRVEIEVKGAKDVVTQVKEVVDSAAK